MPDRAASDTADHRVAFALVHQIEDGAILRRTKSRTACRASGRSKQEKTEKIVNWRANEMPAQSLGLRNAHEGERADGHIGVGEQDDRFQANASEDVAQPVDDFEVVAEDRSSR